ncbi:hypothetical protein [Microbulbifer agarilyticus]
MKNIIIFVLLVILGGCAQKDSGREYVMVYYDSCRDELSNLEKSLSDIGVSFSYQVIEPTDLAAKSVFFNKLIKIQVKDERDVIEAFVNNFLLSCGPNRSVEIVKDKMFSNDEVDALLKRFGAEGKEYVDLRYVDGKLFVLYKK